MLRSSFAERGVVLPHWVKELHEVVLRRDAADAARTPAGDVDAPRLES
jgi:hypothetical protein